MPSVSSLRSIFRVALLLSLVYASTPSDARDAIDQFRAFMAQTQSARADFSQTVTDPKGKVTATSSGKLVFQRPGKFRWQYTKPAQLIVGDGRTVWFYDEDLNQVTVRRLEAAFSSTPAALLAGRGEVESAFVLVAGGETEGLMWLNAEPKQKDAGVERIRMGFSATGLQALELLDAFGNRTRIALSKLEANPKIDASQFSFTPPKGADVVGP